MMRQNRTNYFWSVLLTIGAMLQSPSSPAADEGFFLEEITVTARKREESLQNTPVSISAFTAAELDIRQIVSADQLSEITPNLTFEGGAPSSGGTSSAQIFIRGIGQTDFAPVTDPGVGLYVDGVYLARSGGSVLDFLDIERIEVLRGPQGTLFGKNTIGGAVVVHSKRPGDQLAGSLRVDVGSDNKNYWKATANVPVTETLSTVIALSSQRRDGYVIRDFDGVDLGDDDTIGGRVAVLWTPSDHFEALLNGDYTKTRENGTPAGSAGTNDLQFFPSIANFVEPTCPAPFPLPPPMTSTNGNPNCANLTADRGMFAAGGTFPVFSNVDAWGLGLTLEWDLSDRLTVKSISSHRSLETETSRDPDGSSLEIFHSQDLLDQDQVSQELQFIGHAIDERLHWLLGAYYFHEESDNVVPIAIPSGHLQSGGATDNDSTAFFAQATYDVSEQLSLTFGVRNTEEKKRYTPNQFYTRENALAPFGVAPGFVLSPVGPIPVGSFLLPVQEFQRDFDDTNYHANIAYQWQDNFMTYFSYSTGFKSGGFDQRFAAPPIDSNGMPTNEPSSFEPEFASTFEIGFKGEFLDKRMRLNASLFSTDYEDLQIIIRETFNGLTFNGGDADINGFELESIFVPSPNFHITAAIGYLDAEYVRLADSVLTNNSPVFLDNKLVNSPEWSVSTGVAYTIPVSSWGGTLTPRFDWSFHDEQENDAINTPQTHQDSYHLLNVAVAYETDDGHWLATLAGRNITDTAYIVTGASSFNTASAFLEVVYNRPAEWSFTLEYNFF